MKRIITISIILFLGLGMLAQTRLDVEGEAHISVMRSSTTADENVVRLSNGILGIRRHKIGDIAHGGIVFWVDESGEHGLVSSQSDLESVTGDFQHEWSAGKVVTGATGGEFASGGNGKGAGAMNTMLIVSADRGDTDSAARLCADLLEGGYGDWYLPSKGELNLMYNNLHLNSLGDFNGVSFYWSSSEVSASHAWRQHFNLGSQTDVDKNEISFRVRAVRAF